MLSKQIIIQNQSLDSMAEQLVEVKEQPATLLATNAYSEHKISDIQDNLAIFINNIILYCKLEQRKVLEAQQSELLTDMLKSQLNQLWFEDRLKNFQQQLRLEKEKEEQQPFQKKLYELQQLIRAVSQQKNTASSQEKYIHYENQVNKYIQIIQGFITATSIKDAIDAFQLYSDSKSDLQGPSKETSEIDIPSSHFFRELINTKINYGPSVFNYIRPENHQYYITQAARVYNDVAPFKLKHISLSIADGPEISRPNYFQQDLDESKVIISLCIPGTNKLGYYYLADLCKVHTFSKQLYHEKVLSNDWNFSTYTKSITTRSGKIYAINCRTTKDKIDPYLYQIGENKASNRGPLPSPKRDSSIIYMNDNIYVIGGQGEGEKCSKKSYRYSLKEKKWHQLSDSNVGLRKATVCTINNRYILKLGGLNEFDYINKIIEMYDSLTDRWSLVRASPRNILEQVQILQDSHAVQINDDQVYIFGGKNSNKFSTDTGFVLLISEIKQRRKGAAKVNGQFWNVSVGKRNILTFFGQFFLTSVVIHHNCIYGLRSDVAKTISP